MLCGKRKITSKKATLLCVVLYFMCHRSQWQVGFHIYTYIYHTHYNSQTKQMIRKTPLIYMSILFLGKKDGTENVESLEEKFQQ